MTKVLIPYKDFPKTEEHKYVKEGDTVLIKGSNGYHSVGKLYGSEKLLKVQFYNTANGYMVESSDVPIKVEMEINNEVIPFYIGVSDALNLTEGDSKYLCLEPRNEDEGARVFNLLEFGTDSCVGEEVKSFHLLGYGSSESLGAMNSFS